MAKRKIDRSEKRLKVEQILVFPYCAPDYSRKLINQTKYN